VVLDTGSDSADPRTLRFGQATCRTPPGAASAARSPPSSPTTSRSLNALVINPACPTPATSTTAIVPAIQRLWAARRHNKPFRPPRLVQRLAATARTKPVHAAGDLRGCPRKVETRQSRRFTRPWTSAARSRSCCNHDPHSQGRSECRASGLRNRSRRPCPWLVPVASVDVDHREIPRRGTEAPRTRRGRRWPRRGLSRAFMLVRGLQLPRRGTVRKPSAQPTLVRTPTPATVKPQVKAGDARLRHRLFGAERSGPRTACSGLWAIRGPDPGVAGSTADCCEMMPDLHKHDDGYVAGPREVKERSMAPAG
jgi:hypothetical protein